MLNNPSPMDADAAKAYFNRPDVVANYVQAVSRVGLWQSEEKVFRRLFRPEDVLLDVGCGAGRIAIGLWELGYHQVLGVDNARAMVDEARRLNRVLEYGLSFRVADATSLPFDESEYDGAIFGFNGLMQIPLRAQRQAALREIRRVLKPGAWFTFTTHDRGDEKSRCFGAAEEKRWREARQPPELAEFGDRIIEEPLGPMFMHTPSREEILEDLAATGWRHETDALRALLANEDAAVREFSDDCRFWVAQNS
jgi:ubiquinone/menaquinone biosynthesis C-methylase UbiE